ncbi:dd-gdca protein [Anaeramoeba flamelloides]|uniref:Dd-gdca protein n=1 Tax=Anaeramoeba flamelloides TaxID=1746091 RepID=A0AAV8A2K4_9EUKA|nr:dd-gdca protein [Anaeramoeba flamelloides]|eukprot:Anaeramoba_flamelloidesc26281_g1_i1.p1 GENE.c26281_g1_i1~~c26281_g1_i1.p1  ORF type:complete len:386 (-),score=74.97 c26281_g1_i1:160-1317(-)
MNQLSFLYLLFFLSVLGFCYSSNKCSTIETFHGLNEACDVPNNIFCYESLFCDEDNFCKSDDTGETCYDDDDCSGGVCGEDKKCTAQRDNGDKCKANTECLSGKCSDGACYGLPLDSVCHPGQNDRQCEAGLFCSSKLSKCVNQIEENEECLSLLRPNMTDADIACSPGFVCSPDSDNENGKCVEMYSVEEGKECGITEVCKYGLACQNNVCTSKFTTCDDEKLECPLNSHCICDEDHESGKCQEFANPDCNTEMKALRNCLTKNECQLGVDYVPETCKFIHCSSEQKDLECCQKDGFNNTFYLHDSITCGTPTPTPSTTKKNTGLSTGAKVGIGIGVSAAVLVLIVLIAFFIRKNQKKSIKDAALIFDFDEEEESSGLLDNSQI